MSVALTIAGAAIVLFTALDIALTVLHPEAHGPLSQRADRWAWRACRWLARRRGRRRILVHAGPLAFVVNAFVWLAGLWVGFALIYGAHIELLTFDSKVAFGDRGWVEALYVSGVSLTTLGFGDVVAESDALRLVTTTEAASGLAGITAAITYVLSVYPLITDQREAAMHFSVLGARDPVAAARQAIHGDQSSLEELQRSLIEVHQHVRRFPILHYFDAGEREESVLALIHAGVVMCLVLRWGCRPDRLPRAELHGPPLHATLERLMTGYEGEYVARVDGGPREARDAGERLRVLLAAVAEIDPDVAPAAPYPSPEFAEFLGRADSFLAALAQEHLLDPPQLLQVRSAASDGSSAPAASMASSPT